MRQLWPFAAASTAPAGLLALACVTGDAVPALAAVLGITLVVTCLDRLTVERAVAARNGHRLSTVLGVVHFGLLGLMLWAMGQPAPVPTKALIVVAAGLWFGQVSNSNAHELIHRSGRRAYRLGAAIYASLLIGHHTSAHRLVHHVHAATPLDPATAPAGVGFWRYLPRAWIGGFRAGLRAERRRRGGVRWPAPYVAYGLGALASVLAAAALGGGAGILALCLAAAYAQLQLMLSDYVQHYGLARRLLADGTHARMGPQHSWNAPHWYSAALMLNAPRHSAHHMAPARPFPTLDLDRSMPMLPYSLPTMAAIALVPPLWRRVMDPRVAARRDGPARDPAARARAHAEKPAATGVRVRPLPEWGHVAHRPAPCPVADRLHRSGRRADDGG